MQSVAKFKSIEKIRKIEAIRKSRVLVLAASNIDQDLVPHLYSKLVKIGKVRKLDVLIHCRGGVVNSARRMALLLRKFADEVSFIVPFYCESAGTILSLCGDEILCCDMSSFTPIDPQLSGSSESEGPSTLSCQDIKKFGDMCQNWFGIDSDNATMEQLTLLCNSIFPPSLTAFYRITAEVEDIAFQLLSYQLPSKPEAEKRNIIKKLMYGYNSHHYSITAEEMAALGLNIVREKKVENLAWDVSEEIQKIVGGGLRNSLEEPWIDVMLLSNEQGKVRFNRMDGLAPKWKSIEIDS